MPILVLIIDYSIPIVVQVWWKYRYAARPVEPGNLGIEVAAYLHDAPLAIPVGRQRRDRAQLGVLFYCPDIFAECR